MAWTLFQRLFTWASGKRIGPAPGQLDLNTEFDHAYDGINQLGADLDTHKVAADHDTRYYTQLQTDTKIAQAAIGVIPLNSIDGNKLVNGTVTQSKLSFTPATLDGTGRLPASQLPPTTALASDLLPFAVSGLHVIPQHRVIRFNAPLPPDVSINWGGSWYREWSDATEGGAYYSNNTSAGTDSIIITFMGNGLSVLTAALPATPLSWTFKVDGGTFFSGTFAVQPVHVTHDMHVRIADNLSFGQHTVEIRFNTPAQMFITGFAIFNNTQSFTGRTTIPGVVGGVAWANGTRAQPSSITVYPLGAEPATGVVHMFTVSTTGTVVMVPGEDRSLGNSTALYRIDARDFNYGLTDDSDSLTWLQNKPDGTPLMWPHAKRTRWTVNGFRRTAMNDATKGPRYYADFMGQSAVQSNVLDNFIVLHWVGTDLDLMTYMGPDQGIFAYSNDNGTDTLRDNYSPTVAYQVKVRVATGLKYGTHQTKIRVTATKAGLSSGTMIIVDGFEVSGPKLPTLNPGVVPLAYMVYPPGDARTGGIPADPTWPNSETGGWMRYESGTAADIGAWTTVADPAFSGGSAYQTVATAATVQLTFTFVGWKVRVNARKFSGAGIMAISVDGGAETNVDLYSVTDVKSGVVFVSGVLDHGLHTITLRQTGTKNASSTGNNITVDFFELQQASQLVDIRTVSPTRDSAAGLMNQHTDPIMTPHPHRQYLRVQDSNVYVNRGWRSEVRQEKLTATTAGAKSLAITFYNEFMNEPYVFANVSGPSATGTVYGITSLTTTGCIVNMNAPATGDYYVVVWALGL